MVLKAPFCPRYLFPGVQPGLQQAHPVVQGGVGAAGAYKGLLEGIWAVLLQVGDSGLVPVPGCRRRGGCNPKAGSVSWCPHPCGEGWGGVGSNMGDSLGAVGGPPHPETGTLSVRSQAELGWVCGWDPQGWGGGSSYNCCSPKPALHSRGRDGEAVPPPAPPLLGWYLRARLLLTQG